MGVSVLKKTLLAIVISTFTLLLIGCSTSKESQAPVQSTQQSEGTQPAADEAASNLDDLLEQFKAAGLTVGEKEPKLSSMIGAKDGFGVNINGMPIEIYQFDISSTDETAVQNMKSAKDTGKINMLGIDFPVKMNRDLMLVNYQGHPDEEKIVKVFTGFKG